MSRRSLTPRWARLAPWALACGLLAAACDERTTPQDPPPADAAPPDGPPADHAPPDRAPPDDGPLDATPPDGEPDAAPDPGPAFTPRPRNPPTATLSAPPGMAVARGLIHMHNVFSHDACDGEPLFEDGTPDEACHQRMRAAFCHNRHDFVLMTDHPDSVERRTLSEALYHRPGDTLELRDGAPVANRIPCDDGHSVLLTAGSEGDLMPVMFQRMPDPARLRDRSPAGIAALRDAGALVFQAHMERFDGPTAAAWDLDGHEIYNIHANLDPGGPVLREVLPDIAQLVGAGFDGPHPDLWFTGIFRAGDAALATWDWTLARRRMLGFAGSDTHENVPLPIDTGDGERIESYRRIGGWFSNRLLLDGPVSYDAIRAALLAGRLYVVLDAFGQVDGFDVRAEGPAGDRLEMGDDARFAPGWRILVDAPDAPPAATVEIRLLRITEDGPAIVAQTTDPTLTFEPPGPGAYRVEIWLTPEHLRPEMGALAERFIRHGVWVYANPIYLWPAEMPPE